MYTPAIPIPTLSSPHKNNHTTTTNTPITPPNRQWLAGTVATGNLSSSSSPGYHGPSSSNNRQGADASRTPHAELLARLDAPYLYGGDRLQRRLAELRGFSSPAHGVDGERKGQGQGQRAAFHMTILSPTRKAPAPPSHY